MPFDTSGYFRDCGWCGLAHAQMNHAAAFEAKPYGRPERSWTVMWCPECGSPTLVETSGATSTPRNVSVFPDATNDVTITGLPSDVEGYYRDAIKVLRAGVPDAAAVQLRRTLEAAAAHHEVKEKVLVKSIEKLIDKGLVTTGFGKALHHIRLVGNLGAHHTDARVDQETAERALRFTTALLRNLFEVPAELASLQQDDEETSQSS